MEVERSRKFYGQVAWSTHRKEVLSKEALAQGGRETDTETETERQKGIRETGIQVRRSFMSKSNNFRPKRRSKRSVGSRLSFCGPRTISGYCPKQALS